MHKWVAKTTIEGEKSLYIKYNAGLQISWKLPEMSSYQERKKSDTWSQKKISLTLLLMLQFLSGLVSKTKTWSDIFKPIEEIFLFDESGEGEGASASKFTWLLVAVLVKNRLSLFFVVSYTGEY